MGENDSRATCQPVFCNSDRSSYFDPGSPAKMKNCQMDARSANATGEEYRSSSPSILGLRAPVARQAKLVRAEQDAHSASPVEITGEVKMLRAAPENFPCLRVFAAHHENAALGSDANAVNVCALKFRRTYGLVHRRALVEVRTERLALIELEVHRHRLFSWLVRVLRRA